MGLKIWNPTIQTNLLPSQNQSQDRGQEIKRRKSHKLAHQNLKKEEKRKVKSKRNRRKTDKDQRKSPETEIDREKKRKTKTKKNKQTKKRSSPKKVRP